MRDDALTACTRAKAELRSVFETDQMESIFELVRAGFGLSVVPAMASSNAAGCTLVRLHTKSYRRIGYIRARRHLVSRPMREFTSWVRSIAKDEKRKAKSEKRMSLVERPVLSKIEKGGLNKGRAGDSMASAETATAVTSTIPQLPNHKVKIKKTGQRSCNEKNEKGKFCGGHLKRWFYTADVLEQECGCVEKAWGPDAEVYRCEFCQTLYLPSPEDPRGVNVAGRGQLSVFGLTIPPKEEKKT